MKESEDENKYMFHPGAPMKMRWDIFTSILVIYTCVIIPFNLAFDSEYAKTKTYKLIDSLIDGVFLTDVLVNFNTCYFDPSTDKNVYSYKKIALNYLAFWFWVDFLGSFPFVAVVEIFNLTKLATYLSFMKILKMFRLNRLGKLSDKLVALNLTPTTISLVMLLMTIFFIIHIFACIWYWITTGAIEVDRTWVEVFGFTGAFVMQKYVASYYFVAVTMMTIGYGNKIHGTNEVEYLTAIVIMLVGSIVFGALISKVTKVLAGRDPHKKMVKEKLDELKMYMEEKVGI